jgi:hypothetical protein
MPSHDVSSEKEWAALIERIAGSKGFSAAKKRRKLLRLLFENRQRRLNGNEVEELFFGEVGFDPARSRNALKEVRDELKKYAMQAAGDRWVCELPSAEENDGYQLLFRETKIQLKPSQCFWQPHVKTAEDVIVVSGSHLFFFDSNGEKVLRYTDVNVDNGKKETLSALKAAHKDCDVSVLEPWHNTYLATGDVQAYEALLRWFHRESGTGTLIRRVTSRDVTEAEVHRRTPILIGRPQTNPFIEKMMDSRHAAHLGYRIHTSKGMVRIKDIRPEEKVALSRFPISADGVVGPVTESGVVFGIVTRLRNPSGYGHVTIIACDYYAMVIARIAEALTNDKHAQEFLNRMKWPENKELPHSFEMLFAVTLSPGNLEGEGYPELLAWRMS